MGWPKTLVLVRHAESVGNTLSSDERANYPQSTWEYPLTARGREQARITGEHLQKRFPQKFGIYYVSYYTRSKETMGLMYPDVRVFEDPRLAEGQRGIFHTMTNAKIAMKYPEEVRQRNRDGLYHYRPPGGENWPDIELRIHSFLGTLNRDCDDTNVLMVVHGHWQILFERLIHHFSIEEAVHRYHEETIENASVTIYKGVYLGGGFHTRNRLQLVKRNIVPWRDQLPTS